MFLALTGAALVIVAIIAFILIIGVTIILHELGHLYFAKKAGILCHEFSIGMGPVVYKKKKNETNYCVRALPIGGYVAMAGEEATASLVKIGDEIGINLDGDEIKEIILDENRDCEIRGKVQDVDLYGENDNALFITLEYGNQGHYYKVKEDAIYIFEKNKELQITPYNRCFESKKMLPRILTILAGPVMNLILAIVIYMIVAFATGVPNYGSNRVGTISENSPISEYLVVGDSITGINDISCDTWTEFQAAINKAYETSTTMKVSYLHDGVAKECTVTALTGINSIGITNYNALANPFDKGVVLGNAAPRYKDAGKTGKAKLKTYDVITKISVNGEIHDVNDWEGLTKIFASVSTATEFKFEYYSYTGSTETTPTTLSKEDYELISFDDCGVLENYTDEVLNNQRIEKFSHYIGVSPEMHFDFFGCIGSAFVNFWQDFTLIFRTLKLLIAPSDVRQVGVGDLSSFVGIFQMVETYIGAGFLPLLSFAALLSVNIGVMNLLPIPALDGGRLVFLLYELITRKKPSKKVENTINNIFFILLMILLVFVTFNDILRLFR